MGTAIKITGCTVLDGAENHVGVSTAARICCVVGAGVELRDARLLFSPEQGFWVTPGRDPQENPRTAHRLVKLHEPLRTEICEEALKVYRMMGGQFAAASATEG